MKPVLRVLRSWEELAPAVEGRLSDTGAGCVSFDVFDTLVKRRCHPQLVVRGVATALREALDDPPSIDDILQARHDAYAVLADRQVVAGRDGETDLASLCDEWAARVVPDGDAATRERLSLIAREAEHRLERLACYPNEHLLTLCRKLHGAGHRLVYVSDMYLGDAIVNDILEQCGFGGLFAAGYVSGDYHLLKRTGRLFHEAARLEHSSPGAILHVGDDRHSDGERAIAAGWPAIVVRDRHDVRRRRREQFDMHCLAADPTWAGVVAAGFIAAADERPSDESYRVGRDLLGPQLAAMVAQIVTYARRERIERVYFLSREGLVLRAMYDEMAAALQREVPSSDYLCVSRISTSYGAMREHYGLREVISAAQANANKSVRRLLAPLDFDENELCALATECGIPDLDSPANYHESPAFARLVGHPRVSQRTREVAADGTRALRAYLRGRGFYAHQRVMVIDVGWGAQIQENLCMAVAGENDAPEIHGVYLGANRFAIERRAGGLRVAATLADESAYEWTAGAAFDFVQSYEILTRAPHGTVLGYADAEPVLAAPSTVERGVEDSEDARISRAQLGMIDAARLYAHATSIIGCEGGDTLRYVAALACRVNRFPRRAEAAYFLSFRNVSNFGVPETLALGGRAPWWRPLKLLEEINRALWSEGVARRSLGTPGTLLLAVLKARRTRRLLPSQDVSPPAMDSPAHTQTAQTPAPQPVRPHAFEAAMLAHWRRLMCADEACSGYPRSGQACEAINWGEVLVMVTAHRLSGIYLRLRGLEPLRGELPSTSRFLQRALFTRFAAVILPLRRVFRRWILR